MFMENVILIANEVRQLFMENVILIAKEVRQLFMENVILIAKEVRHVHKHLFTFKYRWNIRYILCKNYNQIV